LQPPLIGAGDVSPSLFSFDALDQPSSAGKRKRTPAKKQKKGDEEEEFKPKKPRKSRKKAKSDGDAAEDEVEKPKKKRAPRKKVPNIEPVLALPEDEEKFIVPDESIFDRWVVVKVTACGKFSVTLANNLAIPTDPRLEHPKQGTQSSSTSNASNL